MLTPVVPARHLALILAVPMRLPTLFHQLDGVEHELRLSRRLWRFRDESHVLQIESVRIGFMGPTQSQSADRNEEPNQHRLQTKIDGIARLATVVLTLPQKDFSVTPAVQELYRRLLCHLDQTPLVTPPELNHHFSTAGSNESSRHQQHRRKHTATQPHIEDRLNLIPQ